MKKVVLVILSIAFMMVLAACSPSLPVTGSNPTSVPTMAMPTGGPTTKPAATTSTSAGTEVSIANFAFSPGTLMVKVGTTVKWMNNDSTAHTVTADDKSFDSGNLDPGRSFSFTFKQTGTFSYHCKIHPTMQAKIVVTGG